MCISYIRDAPYNKIRMQFSIVNLFLSNFQDFGYGKTMFRIHARCMCITWRRQTNKWQKTDNNFNMRVLPSYQKQKKRILKQ